MRKNYNFKGHRMKLNLNHSRSEKQLPKGNKSSKKRLLKTLDRSAEKLTKKKSYAGRCDKFKASAIKNTSRRGSDFKTPRVSKIMERLAIKTSTNTRKIRLRRPKKTLNNKSSYKSLTKLEKKKLKILPSIDRNDKRGKKKNQRLRDSGCNGGYLVNNKSCMNKLRVNRSSSDSRRSSKDVNGKLRVPKKVKKSLRNKFKKSSKKLYELIDGYKSRGKGRFGRSLTREGASGVKSGRRFGDSKSYDRGVALKSGSGFYPKVNFYNFFIF